MKVSLIISAGRSSMVADLVSGGSTLKKRFGSIAYGDKETRLKHTIKNVFRMIFNAIFFCQEKQTTCVKRNVGDCG